MATEVIDVTVADAGGLDTHHSTAWLRIGYWEVAHLPGFVSVEHDSTTHISTLSRSFVAFPTARRVASHGPSDSMAGPTISSSNGPE